MIHTLDRQRDILKIISKLDITPTMYDNAVSKYTSITNYLKNNGIEADMYPQGSFALGTVVRPNAKDENASYDLDFVCQVHGTREEFTAAELRKSVEEILKKSDLYGGKLHIFDECITIEYAAVNDFGFSIDIVPAVEETEENKKRLALKSHAPELIDTVIAIPKHCDKNYNWITNNPKGYCTWFNRINEPYQTVSRKEFRQRLFESNRAFFASVEEIPKELERSSVQRVIQILKYHRDIYYQKLQNGDDIKPISAILNTIVARIATNALPSLSVLELLGHVLNEFETYSKLQMLSEEMFYKHYQEKNVILKKDGRWVIENPANPEDNLADQWNKDPLIAKHFFGWLEIVRLDLIDSLLLEDQDFRIHIQNAFGKAAVSNTWGNKYVLEPSIPIINTNPAKPWRVR